MPTAGNTPRQSEPRPAKQLDATPCPIHRLFVIADWLARTYQRRVYRVLSIVYLLAAATGFAFFAYTHVAAHYLININLFLVFFLAGTGVVLLSRRREWQRKYLDYRALAEGLRVQSYLRRAGIVDLHSPVFAHDNFMQKQDVELGWIRNVMRSASLEGLLDPAETGPEQVDAVISEWIGTTGGGGQLQYFSTAAARRARQTQARRTGRSVVPVDRREHQRGAGDLRSPLRPAPAAHPRLDHGHPVRGRRGA